jgi:heat-inducible transcriptional repressor
MQSDRRARVLELIVGEYVDTALPVGSEALVRKYRLGVSAATIRNEMAELETEGYISHPHTSAGRVPTAKGYRYFVRALMHEEELPTPAREAIRQQFDQSGSFESWIHLAASVLAQAVENAAVVTAPRTAVARVKHLELVEVQERTALLVLVLDQARLHQQVLTFEESIDQEALSAVAGRLNELISGLTLDEIAAMEATLSSAELVVLAAVDEIMRSVDEGGYDEAYLEGIRNVLSQPEFAGSERVIDLLDLLDQRTLTRAIPFRALAQGDVTVIIGAENPRLRSAGDAIREFSVVLSGYGAPGAAQGALAVLGPTRMHYPRTVSTVRYLADLMSELVEQHYT